MVYAPKPAQQEPVAWGIIASNTGRICQVELDADEVEGHNPKHIVPLYTSPPAQRDIRNATLDEIAAKIAAMPFGDTAASFAVWIREQKT